MSMCHPILPVVLLLSFLMTSTALAHDNLCEPRNEGEDGTHLVVVYISFIDCGWCHNSEHIQTLEEMKAAFREIADENGWSFRAVGMALDPDPQVGFEFLQEQGAFDEIIVGGGWTNLGAEHHIWGVDRVEPIVPHFLIYKQDVQAEDMMVFGERYHVTRLFTADVREWLEGGASWEDLAGGGE